jgi:CubicO group peptidase (beta-lactamase class C family)
MGALWMLAGATLATGVRAQSTLDQNALARLQKRAVETGSDAVLVYVDGKKVLDERSKSGSEPIFLMSCTKSIVGLATLKAISDGKIKNIDEPVADFYPEWNQGRKKLITVRMLLAMTSGVQHMGIGNEVYAAPDSVKLALAAELQTAPGAAFSYNNKAVNILTGIILHVSGEFIDDYVQEHFLDPMGITDWRWGHDQAGNPYGMADLMLRPEDFAKFGQLVLQRGKWDGKELIATRWLDRIGEQSQPYEPLYGLLWWRVPTVAHGTVTAQHLDDLSKGGLDPALLARLRTLQGRSFSSPAAFHGALASVLPDFDTKLPVPGLIDGYGNDLPSWAYGGFDGIEAVGYLGQYLVVFPARKLVAVRMIRPFDGFNYVRNRFEGFADMVREVVPASTATPGMQ